MERGTDGLVCTRLIGENAFRLIKKRNKRTVIYEVGDRVGEDCGRNLSVNCKFRAWISGVVTRLPYPRNVCVFSLSLHLNDFAEKIKSLVYHVAIAHNTFILYYKLCSCEPAALKLGQSVVSTHPSRTHFHPFYWIKKTTTPQ